MNDINSHTPLPAARPKGLTVKSLESLSLLSVIEKSPCSWGIKDRESRWVYANEIALEVNSLPVGLNVEGKLDSEFNAPWAEFAPEFQKQDRQAEESRKTTSIISTQLCHREPVLEPYLYEKSPLYNEAQECIGTIWCGSRFNFCSLPQYFRQFTPSVLTLNPPTDMFTEKERETLFFALQDLNSREISKRMGCSPKTTENRLQDMYQKVEVHSFSSFKEFCREAGFEHYIPPKFLKAGVQFFLQT